MKRTLVCIGMIAGLGIGAAWAVSSDTTTAATGKAIETAAKVDPATGDSMKALNEKRKEIQARQKEEKAALQKKHQEEWKALADEQKAELEKRKAERKAAWANQQELRKKAMMEKKEAGKKELENKEKAVDQKANDVLNKATGVTNP
jgi:Skp family chaperone for outer membrane proteins